MNRAVACLISSSLLLAAGHATAQPRPVGPVAPPAAGPKLTKPPKLVKFVEAPYPASERAAGKAAQVVLQIAISATGAVDQAIVKESAGAAFDAAALEAVKKFVFEPAEIDDKPAPIRILYRYEFVWKAEIPTKGIFEGIIKSRKTKGPLPNVTVELSSGQRATTNAEGRFLIEDVPPGKHVVTLSGDGLTQVRTEETFEAAKRLDAAYTVDPKEAGKAGAAEQDDLEIVVVAPPIQKQVVSTEVTADQARRVPGTQGDVLKVVESLPGVGRPPVGSGALVVWGAAPNDTRIYIQDVRVPLLYHNGGLRSVISSDFVRSVELAPGGYGAAYGRGIGGLVTVALKPLEDDGFHGSVAADALDASAAVKASVTDKLRVAVAFRKSYLDRLVPLFTSADIGELFPIPSYMDGQARVVYAFDKRSDLELGGLISSDSIERVVPSSDPSLRKSEQQDIRWNRVYLRYRRELDGGGEVTITPAIGTDSTSLVSRFGGTPTELAIDSTVVALRTVYRGKPEKFLTVTVGVDAEAVASSARRAGSVTAPPREGDVRVFGQAPSAQVNVDHWSTVITSLAAFGELDVSLLDGRLHIVPGARFEPYVIHTSRRTPVVGDTPAVGAFTETTAVEPRIAAHVEVSKSVRIKAAYGLYHQAPLPEDLSAVFGNPLLETSSAHHFLIGAQMRLVGALAVETTGFYSASEDLPVRSPFSSPLLAAALEQYGIGRAYGIQLLVRKELAKGFFGWISYSLMRSERRDNSFSNFRLFDFDQTHVMTALASYEIGWGFEVGARFRVASGLPRTPVVGAYYDARTDLFQPVFGRQNSERIPPFYQLDVRATKKFRFGKTTLEAYVDVQNVTNRQNPEEIVYSRDYSQRAFITGLPILPAAGLRFSW